MLGKREEDNDHHGRTPNKDRNPHNIYKPKLLTGRTRVSIHIQLVVDECERRQIIYKEMYNVIVHLEPPTNQYRAIIVKKI